MVCLILRCSPKPYASLLVLPMMAIHHYFPPAALRRSQRNRICPRNGGWTTDRCHFFRKKKPLVRKDAQLYQRQPHVISFHLAFSGEKPTAPNPSPPVPSLPPLHTSLPRCRLRDIPQWSGHEQGGPRSNVPATTWTSGP